MDVAVPGYEPLLLGADAAAAGAAVGGRMEEISAVSRELTLQVRKAPNWPRSWADLQMQL